MKLCRQIVGQHYTCLYALCSKLNVDSALPYQIGDVLTGEGADFGLGGAGKRFQ